MPVTVSEVYRYHVEAALYNKEYVSKLTKAVCYFVFTRQKWIQKEDEDFWRHCAFLDVPEDEEGVPYAIVKAMDWGVYSKIEIAILWNTYSKEIEKALLAMRSTIISL
eukprot:1763220-Ditylum_brightwellii.AAC.1